MTANRKSGKLDLHAWDKLNPGGNNVAVILLGQFIANF